MIFLSKISTMKRIAIIGLCSAMLIGYTSCSSFKQMNSRRDGDDVYYSLKDAKKDRALEKKRAEAEKKQKETDEKQKALDQQTTDARSKPGSDYYDKDFNYDDYYDYEYASRLRHFDHPVAGAGYYDNYYTNSYFYNQDPYYYGTSVYNGYNFWGPSYYAYNYNPSSYWMYNNGWAWGTGYNAGWGNQWGTYYDPWNQWGYNPYGSGYGYGYGYNPYGCGYGYGNGMGSGYGSGYNNYYYNSFDSNSNYYGPRNTPSSSDGRVAGSGGPTFGERFEQRIASENHLQNPTREQINHIVGVPPAQTTTTTAASTSTSTERGNNSTNTYNSSSGTVDTRTQQTGTSSTSRTTTTNNSSNGNTIPANPNYQQPTGPTYNHPAGSTAGSSPSGTYTPPARTEHRAEPVYSAPSSSSGNQSRGTSTPSGGSSSGNSGGTPRPSGGTVTRPR